MPQQRSHRLSRGGFPHLRHPAVVAGQQPGPVGAEGHDIDCFVVR
jgi:hypothetical protein